MEKEEMIKVEYENKATNKTFKAYFETIRGADIFTSSLKERGVEYDIYNY